MVKSLKFASDIFSVGVLDALDIFEVLLDTINRRRAYHTQKQPTSGYYQCPVREWNQEVVPVPVHE